MNNKNAFNSDASVEAIEAGYAEDGSGRMICVFCGAAFEPDRVYGKEGELLTARGAVRRHVEEAHGGVFRGLMALGPETLGLSPIQAKVVEGLWEGRSDQELAAALGGVAASTVRNHRAKLRAKRVEARLLLAILEILDERLGTDRRYVGYHADLPVRDDRAVVTEAEADTIAARFFAPDGVALVRFPPKEKQRLVILARIATRFERGRRYTEKEVNEELLRSLADYATLRRYLIEYRFLMRERDCSAYWRP